MSCLKSLSESSLNMDPHNSESLLGLLLFFSAGASKILLHGQSRKSSVLCSPILILIQKVVSKFLKKKKKHPKNWETALWGKVRLYWKKSFIERKALLKERLYWKKGLIETNSKIWPNSKIWSKFWNLVEILKFGQIFEILPKTWNLVEILKFG